MFIAQEKLQSNIAEYIIYMYQVEDLMRAYRFDIDKIREDIIRPQVKSEAFEKEAVEWYKNIIHEMESRNLEEKGHLYSVGEVMTELIYLHKTLVEVAENKKYIDLLKAAEENIKDFRKKSGLETNHDIEVCFQALYMKLLLRLKGESIGGESEEAFDSMRIVLAYLASGYHKMKAGDMSMFEK